MTDTKPQFPITALAVGEFQQDRTLLREIFGKLGWRLLEAADRRHAIECLKRNLVHVVLAESAVTGWDWKKVLRDIRRLAVPPQLIVASRTADDYLWAEVLNIGGYDVLPQPLERDEVERVVAAAHRHSVAPERATLGAAAPTAFPNVA